MTPEIYDSLIDLQDKLHSGLGRKRTIVSIGTYDLDTLVPQEGDSTITYDAIKPSDFHLVPLNRTQSVDGLGLMTMLESDLKLKKFLPLIRDLPKYPVLRDARGTVMSVPPIINGDSSKITLNTRNIFIDVTGIDEQKVLTALDILVCAFSRYGKPSSYNVSGEQCGSVQEDGSPHEYVESVTILNAENNEIRKTPALSTRSQLVSISYVNDIVGVSFTGMQMIDLIKKMMLGGRLVMKKGLEESSFSSEDYIEALIPPNRPDIIHECDVMEDVAIAYGFNRIPATVPTCPTNAEPLPINKFTDQLRREVALAGFTEVLTFSLCSHAENFSMIRRQDPGNEAIVLSNPKTAEFEVVHTSLLPSMLKTLSSNRKMPLPQRIFQVADVVLKVNAGDNFDYSTNVQYALEVGARNERRLCIVQCGTVSGFEVIHGILDRLMQVLNVRPTEYSISPSESKFILNS